MYFILRKQEIARIQSELKVLTEKLENFDKKINDENNTTDMKSFYYESKFQLLTAKIARFAMDLEDFQNSYKDTINVCQGHVAIQDLYNEPEPSIQECSTSSADDACKEF
jgi:hypothetical protein